MAIAIDDRIGSAAVAKLFGVSLEYLNRTKPFLQDFPSNERVGKKRFYSLAAINTWAEGKNVKALVREGYRKYRRGETADEHNQEAVLTLSRCLHAGEFAPLSERKAIARRRLSAMTHKPKTTTVQIRPEWYL